MALWRKKAKKILVELAAPRTLEIFLSHIKSNAVMNHYSINHEAILQPSQNQKAVLIIIPGVIAKFSEFDYFSLENTSELSGIFCECIILNVCIQDMVINYTQRAENSNIKNINFMHLLYKNF